jgi:hypothetical protein
LNDAILHPSSAAQPAAHTPPAHTGISGKDSLKEEQKKTETGLKPAPIKGKTRKGTKKG